MVFFALVVPLIGTASAATVDNSCDLDVTLEAQTNATGTTQSLVATLTNGGGGACVDTTYEVDFEVESGPAITRSATSTSSNTGASDADNSPATPDATCTASAADPPEVDVPAFGCSISFTSAVAGTNVIRGWVDDDKDNVTFDADSTEGAVAGTTPGSRTEEDDTDVVTASWFTALNVEAKLDCTPETATNPNTGAGSTETYTCNAWVDTDNDGVKDAGETAISGMAIDGENLNGANDPDNDAAGGVASTADYNNGGTTDANGTATIIVAASETQAGQASICFWMDADADNIFFAAGTQVEDGNDCDTETNGEAETTTDPTDRVSKTWLAVGAPFTLSLSPESDQNLKGQSHTVTATVTDAFGTPVAGQFVDFDVSGRNDGVDPNADQFLTGLNGTVDFTYTDVNTGTPNGEQDAIYAYVDNDDDDSADTNAASQSIEDTVFKYWFTTLPVVDEVVLSFNACTAVQAGADTAQTSVVGQDNDSFCATVLDAANAPIPGASVTFTSTGVGGFFDYNDPAQDTDGDGSPDDDEVVTTLTITTNGSGEADSSGGGNSAYTYSEETGQQTITAAAGAVNSNLPIVETYTPDDARNIDCDPATATNPTGTEHLVTCTATDEFGNVTPFADNSGDLVTVSETGIGRLDSADEGIAPGVQRSLNANGEIEIITSTTAGEEGTQSITAQFTGDDTDTDVYPADDDDSCDAPAANDGDDEDSYGYAVDEYTAGNCEQTVEKVWTDTLVETDHGRTNHLNTFKHINLGGGQRSLKVSGTLSTDDGFDACSANQPIKVQIRAGGEWITRKSDTTNASGKFSVLIRDITKKYRAVASKTQFVNDDGTADNCLRAISNVRKHKH